MSAAARRRLAVLISGSGSNLQALLDACAAGHLPAEVVLVVSNTPQAFGLERARAAGIPAVVLEKQPGQTRRDYDAALAMLVQPYQPDLIVLAGWMRLLTCAFLECFPNRVINLHPALPGKFPGTQAIERAYAAYQAGEIQSTGVMVHYVPDEGVDCGPVVASTAVPIQPGDTLEALTQRVHHAEHRLLIEAVASVLQ